MDHHLSSQEKLALLNEIGRLVLSSQDLDQLFVQAAELLRTRLGLQLVMIGTFDRHKQSIVLRATAGIARELVAQRRSQSIGEGIIGEVWKTGKSALINDVSADPRYLQGIPTTRSELCVPLIWNAEPAGFLNLESDRVGAFERVDVDLLEAAGSFLGEAIRNTRLRQELEDSRNYLAALVENAGDAIITFDLEGRVRTWNGAALSLLGLPPESVISRDLLELVQSSSGQLQQAYQRVIAGEAIRGIRISQVRGDNDNPRTLEVSMAPILDGRKATSGVSCILRDVTLEVQVQEGLRENLEAMQLLNEVSVELASILDLDPLLEKIAQIIRHFIEHEFFAILLVNESTQEFVWKMARGFSAESLRELAHFSIHEGVVGRVARTRTPVIADDVQREADYKPIRAASGAEPHSELALPLVYKDRMVGVLMLGSMCKGYFRPHHLKLLTPLAAQIAVSIENAHLYDEKTRDAATQQVMNEVGKEMTAILELDELLNRIAALMNDIKKFTRGTEQHDDITAFILRVGEKA